MSETAGRQHWDDEMSDEDRALVLERLHQVVDSTAVVPASGLRQRLIRGTRCPRWSRLWRGRATPPA